MNCSNQIPITDVYIRQKKIKIKWFFAFFFTFLAAYLLSIF